MTCVGGVLDCESKDKRATNAKKGPDDEVGFAKVSETSSIVWHVGFGDTPHAVPPLSMCFDAKCQKGAPLVKKDDAVQQLAIAVRDKYVLIGEEYSGAKARVFDDKAKEVANLPNAAAAAFLP